MTTRSGSRTDREAERARRAARILDVAGQLLVTWGYTKITMEDVARRADVGKGTVYLHFPTKEALFSTVLVRTQIEVGTHLVERFREDPAAVLPSSIAREIHLAQERWPILKALLTSDTTTLGSFLNVMAPTFGTAAGWGYSNTWYDHDAGEFVFTGGSEGYHQLIGYVAGLVEEGLLDPEITQSDDQAVQKFISGESAAISGNTQVINEYRTKFADAGQDDVPIRLITIPGGPFGNYLAGSQLSSGLMLSSSVTESPNFLAMLQFIDWLYFSDEGIEFAQWGVQGETYTVADDGERTLADDVDWNGLNPGAELQLNADFGYSNGVFLLANGSTEELLQSVMSPETREWTQEVLAMNETLPVAPAAQLDELELETTSLLDSQLEDGVQAATAAFITGQRSLEEWDAYVAEMEALGSQQLVDTYNEALARQAE